MEAAIRPMLSLSKKAIHRHVFKRSLTSMKQLDVSIMKEEDNKTISYRIRLGDSILKTPAQKPFVVPDESLALAIANEWRSELRKKKVNLTNMHLTTLSYTAIDNPFNESKDDVVDSMIEYLKFDTVRFRDTGNEDLIHLQSRHWDPLIGWFEHKYDCHLPIDYGNLSGAESVPKTSIETIRRLLNSHERWPLVGLNFMTRNLKSLVLSTCLMERFLKVNKAVELARLETRFQVERWSKVEWEHDLDEQCTNARVAAGTLFYHLTV